MTYNEETDISKLIDEDDQIVDSYSNIIMMLDTYRDELQSLSGNIFERRLNDIAVEIMPYVNEKMALVDIKEIIEENI